MPTIQRIHAEEILDSRGRPTVWAACQLAGGGSGAASVPSGASTGSAEALELRDGDPRRYRGLGCRKAVANVNGEIQAALRGREFSSQSELDQALVVLDGTPNKARLGANAILAVSLAFARAAAAGQPAPLYRYFADLVEDTPGRLPRPMINLFSGGEHAGSQVAIQDVQVVPLSASSLDEALATTFEIFQHAAELSKRQYGMRLLRADEGGLAPPFPNSEAMLVAAVEAIQAAGYQPGSQVALAVDVAASHFYERGIYHLDSEELDSPGMVARLAGWLESYPIVSFEDGLAEEDWSNWPVLRACLDGRAITLGDDLLCTNPARIRRAIASRSADALLLKVNQIGTLSEAAEACRLAKSAGWVVVASARSGETEDNWLADLAVGWSADHIKIGSITQSERLAKYNRLLAIERETGLALR